MIRCEGTHLEMGVAQGEALKDRIDASIRRFFSMDVVARFVPADFIAGAAGGLAYQFLMQKLETFDHHTVDRIRGIALGCKKDYNLLMFIQFFESLISSPFITTSACTTALIEGSRTRSRNPLLIKNYDLFTDLADTTILRYSRPRARLRSMELAVSPLTGSHIGINEAGLCVSYNYGMEKSYFKKNLPPTIACQFALENFSRTRQVIDFLSVQGCANGALFTIADETGDMAAVEILGRNMAVLRPENGLLGISNNFIHPDMVRYNYKDTDRYNNLAPRPYQGMRINDTCILRRDRINALLTRKRLFKRISLNEIKRILKDHDGQETGNDNTICRHNPVLSTLASVIADPVNRRMHLAMGNPCGNPYQVINLPRA